jgi:hypothetical protein
MVISRRRSAAPSPASRAASRSAPPPPRPRPAVPRAARQRSGPLRRPGRRLLHRGERAVRRGRGDGPLPARRRRDAVAVGSRGQVFVLDGAHAGELAGRAPLAYDGSELPLADRDVATAQVTTRDIDRGDAPHFLLKEINEAPVSFRKTLRGKIVEQDGLLRVVVGERSLPPRSPPGSPAARSPRCASSARAPRPSPVAAWRPCSTTWRGPARHRPDHGHRAVRLPPAARHERHAHRRRQPERHHHRHQPHGRPRPRPRRLGARDRQPPQQRPHRQGRRRDVHERRPRRRDERRVHQGVLRPGRRRCAAGLRDQRSRRARHRSSPPRPAHLVARAAGQHGRGHRPPRRDRRGRTTVRTVQALLGDRRQRPQRGRRGRGADQAQRALLQVDRLRRHRGQEAHRPVERADDPGVRGRSGGRHRRRRGQGGRDLQGAQGDADRRRHRGR